MARRCRRSRDGLLCFVLSPAAFVHPDAKAVHPRAQVLHLGIEAVQVLLLALRGHRQQGLHHAGCDRYVRRAVLMQVHGRSAR